MPKGWPFKPSFETIKTIFKTIKSLQQNFETIKTVSQLRKKGKTRRFKIFSRRLKFWKCKIETITKNIRWALPWITFFIVEIAKVLPLEISRFESWSGKLKNEMVPFEFSGRSSPARPDFSPTTPHCYFSALTHGILCSSQNVPGYWGERDSIPAS